MLECLRANGKPREYMLVCQPAVVLPVRDELFSCMLPYSLEYPGGGVKQTGAKDKRHAYMPGKYPAYI